MRKTRVHRHIRRTKRGRVIIKKHSRHLKNKGATFVMFDRKKDEPVVLDTNEPLELYSDIDEPSSKRDEVRGAFADEIIALGDEGELKNVSPVIIQRHVKITPQPEGLHELNAEDIGLFRERIERGGYVDPNLKNFIMGKPPARVITEKTISPRTGRVLYTKSVASHDNDEILRTTSSKKFGKKDEKNHSP